MCDFLIQGAGCHFEVLLHCLNLEKTWVFFLRLVVVRRLGTGRSDGLKLCCFEGWLLEAVCFPELVCEGILRKRRLSS